MHGDLQDGGIIPRCLDVIFNSIGHLQTKKGTFIPDKRNSFEKQNDVDYDSDRRKAKILQINNTFKIPSSCRGQENDKSRVYDSTRISAVDDFITFAEVCNNTVFDLLDDTPIDPLRPGSYKVKGLRQDPRRRQHHLTYIKGATDVEVKSGDEAFDLFLRGQKRRGVIQTSLKARKSSWSHSVFNIRVVQAPLDYQGSSPEKMIIVGQLSLIDLAGVEPNHRTGRIDKTPMALHSCIKILRENQQNGTVKKVPYRDSKITRLFKSYFEGKGNVRMIVCVNHVADNYDEALSAMIFAEMAPQVKIREQHNRHEQLMKKCVDVRTMIADMEDELIFKRQEVQILRAEIQAERSRCQTSVLSIS